MPSATTRLFISPFAPDSLSIVLNPTIERSAKNISFHQIQTFPERNYGYLDLPVADADTLKKRLNGSIVKGRRMKVEEARPMKRKHGVADPDARPGHDETQKQDTSPQTRRKKRKEDKVLAGHEMPEGRKVKRGWTEPGKEKSKSDAKKTARPRSKYTESEELLFRTKVPPNKQETRSRSTKKSKKPTGDVVHEFEKSTTHPKFLKESSTEAKHSEMSYVDGQGWVDGDGAIVESETSGTRNLRRAAAAPEKKAKKNDKPKSTARSPIRAMAAEVVEQSNEVEDGHSEIDTESTSSEGSSSTSDDASDASGEQEVHPLEALFKKPKKPASQEVVKPSLEVETAFSFFEQAEDVESEDDMEVAIPGTPFSSQDLQYRGTRSAAPTPDTAYPSRFNSYGSSGLPGDESLENSEDETPVSKKELTAATKAVASSSKDSASEPSEYEKQFWEKRGENNRAWKARRRAVLKEKRQRENRARRPKNW